MEAFRLTFRFERYTYLENNPPRCERDDRILTNSFRG